MNDNINNNFENENENIRDNNTETNITPEPEREQEAERETELAEEADAAEETKASSVEQDDTANTPPQRAGSYGQQFYGNGQYGQNQPYQTPNNPPQYNNAPYGQGYSNNSQGYMPYSSFGGQTKPEAPKEPSKHKKKGVAIAFSVIAVTLVIAVGTIIGVTVQKTKKVESQKDNTQLVLTENDGAKNDNNTNGGMTPADVYNKVHESSVGIVVYSGTYQKAVGEGTGVVMGLSGDKKGSYIITCAHVINTANAKIVVQTVDGTQYEGEVVGIDTKTDIGLVYVNSTKLKAAEFADTESLSVGENVYAIGNPGGTQFFGSFTDGMISAIGRPINSPVGYEVQCIQHTAAINPGNSGGALVNSKGQVIGINSSKIASTQYEGMGFAVPMSTVKEIVDQLIKNGKVVNRPVLGVTISPVTSNQTYAILAQSNELPSGSVIVSSIMNGSDMATKGVKSGDMIIAVNGEELETYDDLLNAVEDASVGDIVKLTICRVDSSYKISKFDVNVKLVSDADVSEEKKEQTQTIPFPFGQ